MRNINITRGQSLIKETNYTGTEMLKIDAGPHISE